MRRYLIVPILAVAASAAVLVWAGHRGIERRSPSSDDIIPEHSVTADAQFALSERDLGTNLERARQGDAVAARLLSYHFGARRNEPERLKWLIAAGKAGDCASVLNLQYEKALSAAETRAWSEKSRALKCDPRKEFGITVKN